jgi:hypothetical protein
LSLILPPSCMKSISFFPPTPAQLLGDCLPINRSLEDYLPVRYSILIEACQTACHKSCLPPCLPVCRLCVCLKLVCPLVNQSSCLPSASLHLEDPPCLPVCCLSDACLSICRFSVGYCLSF